LTAQCCVLHLIFLIALLVLLLPSALPFFVGSHPSMYLVCVDEN
jgi:uncharacterized membrane protein YesL